MRLRLTFRRTGQSSVLPINYSYPLSAWIYKILQQGDSNYSDFLHNTGYITAGKRFKLFTFSSLHIPQRRIYQDRIDILSSEVTMILSFYLDQASHTFIEGLFANATCSLGDKYSQVDFKVVEIERLKDQISTQTVHFHTLSPLVICTKDEKDMDMYLSPKEEGYEELLLHNLLNKYQSVGGVLLPEWAEAPVSFRLLDAEPKSRLVTIKDHTREATKIRGYLFDFEFVAPQPILELGLLGGFGRYNAEGFGCCEVIHS